MKLVGNDSCKVLHNNKSEIQGETNECSTELLESNAVMRLTFSILCRLIANNLELLLKILENFMVLTVVNLMSLQMI